MQTQKQRWEQIKALIPVGTVAEGTVVRVAPFGVFVQIPGVDAVAVLLVTHFEDGDRSFEIEQYPQVGDRMLSVVVDHAEHNMQVRLSTRASDLELGQLVRRM